MTLRFCSISSGSSGNSYLVRTDSTSIIVDAGIPAYRVCEGIVRARTELDEVNAILITHEHSDHIKGVQAVANKLRNASVFATYGTWGESPGNNDVNPARTGLGATRIKDARRETFNPGDTFTVGDIHVESIPVSHDAAQPVGYVLSTDGGGVAIITDTGVFTEEHISKTTDADVLVIEANHDVNMLVNGKYPAYLKQRILSSDGHLSNEQTASAILSMFALERKERCILLAHLSAENNMPALAEQTIADRLAENEYYFGRDFFMKALLRDRMSVVFEI